MEIIARGHFRVMARCRGIIEPIEQQHFPVSAMSVIL
jgi:hypothetical protein